MFLSVTAIALMNVPYSSVATITQQKCSDFTCKGSVSDEERFWCGVKNSNKCSDFEKYLRRFEKEGICVSEAKSKMKKLCPSPTPTLPSAEIKTFEFETVRLNRYGEEEVKRKKLKARYFTEDLGNSVLLDMVKIPSGSFEMGSPSNETQRNSNEGPRHTVKVASFWMGKFEITQEQWQAVMDNNPSGFGDTGNLPIEKVSWHDAKEFVDRLNVRQPKPKCIGYRLPSEAEWEYAARAGTTTPFAFGETITPQIVNYDGNNPYANVLALVGEYRRKTIPVDKIKVANAFGLFGMHGNAWEWCEDRYHDSYNGAPTNGIAWVSGGDSSQRMFRGGSWVNNGNNARSAFRNYYKPDAKENYLGFRVVCSEPR